MVNIMTELNLNENWAYFLRWYQILALVVRRGAWWSRETTGHHLKQSKHPRRQTGIFFVNINFE
jgi:hypothetical protein